MIGHAAATLPEPTVAWGGNWRDAGHSLRIRWGQRFAERDGELGLAGFGGIVEGIAGALGFGSLEKESTLFEAVGEAGETGFAVGVGADLEIELVEPAESIGDVDFHFSGVDGLVVGVGDREIGGARADARVD